MTDTTTGFEKLTPLQRALFALKEMKAKLEVLQPHRGVWVVRHALHPDQPRRRAAAVPVERHRSVGHLVGIAVEVQIHGGGAARTGRQREGQDGQRHQVASSSHKIHG